MLCGKIFTSRDQTRALQLNITVNITVTVDITVELQVMTA